MEACSSDPSLALSLAWGCLETREPRRRVLSISFYLPYIAQSVCFRKFYPTREDSWIPVLPLRMAYRSIVSLWAFNFFVEF